MSSTNYDLSEFKPGHIEGIDSIIIDDLEHLIGVWEEIKDM